MTTKTALGPTRSPAQRWLQRLITPTRREPKLTIGLDIGSHSVKVIALGARKGLMGRPIVGQNLVPLPAGQGGDAVSAAIRSAVGTLKLPIKSVNLSVSGQSVIMRVVEMPAMKPDELKQALPFEAQRYLPFGMDEVVIDGITLGPGEGNKASVLIVACKKDLIAERVSVVQKAGLEPALIDVDALALANAYMQDRSGEAEDQDRTAIINVGSQRTNLVIFKGALPFLVRDIPWGNEKLIRQIGHQMGKDADTLMKDLAQEKTSPEMVEGMRQACEGLVTELQLSFDYFENRFGQPPSKVLLSGGVSQSAALAQALKEHIAQDIEPWAPRGGLSGQFSVAFGLALRGN